jgi:hypothetical protein
MEYHVHLFIRFTSHCTKCFYKKKDVESTSKQKGKVKEEKTPQAQARGRERHATASAQPSCKASRK